MAKFRVSKIQPIEYDFAGIPKAGGNGDKCEGSGTIPEPAPEQIDAFIKRVMKVSEDAEGGTEGLSIMSQREGFIDALLDLEVPRDHLEQLPFRVLTDFLVYVQNELFPSDGANG